MTLTQQALHIFKKDVRQLRWEIGALVCLSVFLVWYWTDSWSGETNGDPVRSLSREPAGPYVAAIWLLMIARVFHAEPLIGDRHFWLTRPYARSALLLAKGIFAVAFLLSPLLLAQVLAISLSGLPVSLGALLVNLLAIAAVGCLPAAAVAALTRNLWQYVPLVSVGAIAALAVWLESYAAFSGPAPLVAGALLVGALSVAALLVQFHGRRTLRNAAVYVAASAAGWLLVASFARDLARTVESALDEPGTRSSLALGIGPPPQPGANVAPPSPALVRPPWRLRPVIRLPIEVTGADFRDVVLANPIVTLRTASGETFPLAVNVWRDESGDSLITSALILRDRVIGPRTLGTIPSQLMNEPVSLHVELWVKRFTGATATLPTDGSAVILDGHEQCRAIRPGSRRFASSPDAPPAVMCRHAVSTPAWREHGVSREQELDAGHLLISRMTIPTIDPIARVQVAPFGFSPFFNGPQVTIVRRERAAFFHATFDAENLHLAEYVWD